jgi:hypothetical protein
VPGTLAVGAYLILAVLALAYPDKLREPDPYAYRAAIEAIEQGDLTLSTAEYAVLDARLRADGDGWDRASMGIAQWVRTGDGVWASEKNPGYPFLAVPFDLVGLVRLAPLVYGALGCIGLWSAGRRWLGPWGGTFAVGLFCSPSAMLIMANRATMPSFTDAALLAAGVGALVWVVLATEARWARRVVVGTAAGLALGAAVTVRYTNVAPVAVVAGWVVVAALRPGRGLGWRALVPWTVAGAVPLALAASYNRIVFGGVTAVGYEQAGGLPAFTVDNVVHNLGVMPGRLVASLPVWVLAAAAVALLAVAASRRRLSTDDRWVVPVLVGWWLSVWGLYAAFGWTWQSSPPGAHPIITTRFYLPAVGALALLAAWLFVRVPRAAALVAVVALFVVGGLSHRDAVTSGPVFTSSTIGGPGPAGPGPAGPGVVGPGGVGPGGVGPGGVGPGGVGPGGVGPGGVGPGGVGPGGVGPGGGPPIGELPGGGGGPGAGEPTGPRDPRSGDVSTGLPWTGGAPDHDAGL